MNGAVGVMQGAREGAVQYAGGVPSVFETPRLAPQPAESAA